MNWFKNFYIKNKKLVIGAILFIALFIILYFTNIIKFGWENNTSKLELKQLKNEIELLNSDLSVEKNVRKLNDNKIKSFESSIQVLDDKITSKDKEIQELNIKYDQKIKNIDNLSSSGLAKYFADRYK